MPNTPDLIFLICTRFSPEYASAISFTLWSPLSWTVLGLLLLIPDWVSPKKTDYQIYQQIAICYIWLKSLAVKPLYKSPDLFTLFCVVRHKWWQENKTKYLGCNFPLRKGTVYELLFQNKNWKNIQSKLSFTWTVPRLSLLIFNWGLSKRTTNIQKCLSMLISALLTVFCYTKL